MSRSQLVAEHLPLLRRYARALTGSQASGDAYVAAMLEALLQDPALLEEKHGPRVGLFRLFTQIWNSVSVNEGADNGPAPAVSEQRLSSLTALTRQAFLLLSLEGFSEEEVAHILDTDVAKVRELADAAGRELAAEIATDVRGWVGSFRDPSLWDIGLTARGEHTCEELLAMVDEIFDDVRKRDAQDASRAIAPLKQSPDAVLVDSSEMEPAAVIARICELVRAKDAR